MSEEALVPKGVLGQTSRSLDPDTQSIKRNVSAYKVLSPLPVGATQSHREAESCTSTPVEARRAFFETVFKKEQSPIKSPTRKPWSPRHKMAEASTQTPDIIPSLTSNVRKDSEVTDKSSVPTVSEKEIQVPSPKETANLSCNPGRQVVSDTETTNSSSRNAVSDATVSETPPILPVCTTSGDIQLLSTLACESEGVFVKSDEPEPVNKVETNQEEDVGKTENLSESVALDSPGPGQSIENGATGVTPLRRNTICKIEPNSTPEFSDLRQMWNVKAAESRPLSPENDSIIADASGKKAVKNEVSHGYSRHNTFDSKLVEEEKKQEEPEDMQVLDMMQQLHSIDTESIPNSQTSVRSITASDSPHFSDLRELWSVKSAEKPDKSTPSKASSDHMPSPAEDQSTLSDAIVQLRSTPRQHPPVVTSPVDTSTMNKAKTMEESPTQVRTPSSGNSTDILNGPIQKNAILPTTIREPMDETTLLEDTIDRASFLKETKVQQMRDCPDERKIDGHGSDDDEDDEFGDLREQQMKSDPDAIRSSAASLTIHARRSMEKYQAMLCITESYQPKKSPPKTSPIEAHIQKFEALSRGQDISNISESPSGEGSLSNVKNVPSDAINKSPPAASTPEEKSEEVKTVPKRFSFYTAGKETLSLLERMSEPVDNDTFEEEQPSAAMEKVYKRGYVKPSKGTGSATPTAKLEDGLEEEDDEIFRVTKKASAAVRLAAAKLSKSSSSFHTVQQLSNLPSKETPVAEEGGENIADCSILTDALTTAEMDTTLALDEDIYDQGMALVGLDSPKASSYNGSPKCDDPLSLSRSHSTQVVDQAKCGEACVIM